MTGQSSYLLCCTPRTGSTLLCELLTSTGVAGRPQSYFRHPDQERWAARFGVPVTNDGALDYREFAAGARRYGTTSNGVFAARVMWGTVPGIVDGLSREGPASSDLEVLEAAFGALRLVHLTRDDVVQQAVSWARAEQSGYWQQGDEAVGRAELDLDQIERLVHTVTAHDLAWRSWFRDQGVMPLAVTYEALVSSPRQTVQRILDHVGVELLNGWRADPASHRQADALSFEWARRYRTSRTVLRKRSR